jgi:hypothetical protein
MKEKDRSTLYLACAALGTLALAAAPAPQAHDDGARVQGATSQQQFNNQSRRNDLVNTVRQVTRKYYGQPVKAAEDDGFQLLFGCVSDDDSGAMGLHYVKLDRYVIDPVKGVFDSEVEAGEPEILLYEPTPWGPKITGADYLVDAEAWDKAHPGQTPQLNGQIFHYFGAPNRFGLRPFYTLHVWAWKDSPTGTFVNWHKEVRCDAHNSPDK